MARGLNKVMLIGNLGRDPETRYTQNGGAVTRFSVATTDSWRDRQTNEMQERTEWHNVVCFARLGEIASEYLHKGSKVYIEGRLQTSSWEQDGQTRYRTEIIGREMQMLDSRGQASGFDASPPPGSYDTPAPQGANQRAGQDSGQGSGQSEPAPAGRPASAPASTDEGLDDFDDDIPF